MLINGFTPTPPAMNTTLLISLPFSSLPGEIKTFGGQTKDPPTRTKSSESKISEEVRQSQAAGGLEVRWTASSRYGSTLGVDGKRREGGEVMVKPPGFGSVGMCTSSHCPGRNCGVGTQ